MLIELQLPTEFATTTIRTTNDIVLVVVGLMYAVSSGQKRANCLGKVEGHLNRIYLESSFAILATIPFSTIRPSNFPPGPKAFFNMFPAETG